MTGVFDRHPVSIRSTSISPVERVTPERAKSLSRRGRSMSGAVESGEPPPIAAQAPLELFVPRGLSGRRGLNSRSAHELISGKGRIPLFRRCQSV